MYHYAVNTASNLRTNINELDVTVKHAWTGSYLAAGEEHHGRPLEDRPCGTHLSTNFITLQILQIKQNQLDLLTFSNFIYKNKICPYHRYLTI